MNTKELVEKTRELLEKATEGPWMVMGNSLNNNNVVDFDENPVASTAYRLSDGRSLPEASVNAALIVHLRNHAPALLDALAALEAERDQLAKALEQAIDFAVISSRYDGLRCRSNHSVEAYPELAAYLRAKPATWLVDDDEATAPATGVTE